MRASQVRLLLLLAVMLAALGAIRCAGSQKPKRMRTSFKNFRDGLIRTLSRSRSGSPSGSGSDRIGSGGDGSAGNKSDTEQPASGEFGRSGSGRFPRSRSPSPPVGGGGRRGYGASSSSTSNQPAVALGRTYAGVAVDRIGTICKEVNKRGDAHVVTNMQVNEFANIIREMRQTADNDECKISGKGNLVGTANCQNMYAQFKKIPAQYRGECSNAVSANCLAGYGNTGIRPTGERICAFFIQTDMRTRVTMDGYWVSLDECTQGIKNELFMAEQLASVGIKPPKSPPQPLLPYNYSPDH